LRRRWKKKRPATRIDSARRKKTIDKRGTTERRNNAVLLWRGETGGQLKKCSYNCEEKNVLSQTKKWQMMIKSTSPKLQSPDQSMYSDRTSKNRQKKKKIPSQFAWRETKKPSEKEKSVLTSLATFYRGKSHHKHQGKALPPTPRGKTHLRRRKESLVQPQLRRDSQFFWTSSEKGNVLRGDNNLGWQAWSYGTNPEGGTRRQRGGLHLTL